MTPLHVWVRLEIQKMIMSRKVGRCKKRQCSGCVRMPGIQIRFDTARGLSVKGIPNYACDDARKFSAGGRILLLSVEHLKP